MTNPHTFKASKTKSQVAALLQISPATLRRWLNQKYYAEMQSHGYERQQRILTPAQLNYLAAKLDLSE